MPDVATFPQPSPEEVLDAVGRSFPALARAEASFLAQGWDAWVYLVGGAAIKVPKRPDVVERIERERRLLPELAPTLPLPVPAMEFCSDDGPNGQPFAGHTLVPGDAIGKLPPGPHPGAGRAIGEFLRALHSFPVERAEALGVQVLDGDAWRKDRIKLYEDIVERVFPLLSPDQRSRVGRAFEAYLDDPGNFDFTPALTHADFDDAHVLADPATGVVTGVIDFGDTDIGDPAGDFNTLLHGDLGRVLGEKEVAAALNAAGFVVTPAIERRLAFGRYLWPFHEVLYGTQSGLQEHIEKGLRALGSAAWVAP